MFKGKNFSRNGTIFKFAVSEHFSKYKWMYLILGAVCLTGLITGFIVGFTRADNISLDTLPDSILVAFINKETTTSSIFFSRIFAFIGLLLLVWVTNCKPCLCFITFIILLYRAFLIGVNCSILIILYQVGGVINVILIFLPVHLIALFALLVWCCVCFYTNLVNKKMGYNILNLNFIACNKGCFFCTIILAIIAYVFEAILLPYLTSAVFIGVG